MQSERTLVRGRRTLFLVPLVLLTLVVAAIMPHVAGAGTVARGIADPPLTEPGTRMSAEVQAESLEQIGSKLRASYVRFVVSWAVAEPEQGVYDETYLAGVDRAVALAKANGLKVMITFAYVPRWASDSAYWYNNPFAQKGYDRRYAMKTDATTLAAFQEFCRQMASRFRVWGFECWNEPNLHLTLYPQSTAKDKDIGAHIYVKMLRSFSAGIREGDPLAVRLAGGTAPRGYSASDSLSLRRMMTSPQRFALVVRAAGVGSLFDGYSHHAYTPGASSKNWPEAAPRDPTTTVNLQNLGTLLKLFPSKPFYITEYGYQTAACASFSGQHVSLTQQADYLRRAYAYAGRYRQVKMLMWYLLDDFSPSGKPNDYTGFYTGLRNIFLQKKPAWYVFARGNTLTLTAPSSSSSGAAVTLSGKLSSATDGPIAGKTLVIQSHTAGKPWAKLRTAQTDALGSYAVTIRPTRSTYYRVVWTAVATSPVSFVRVN